LRLALALVFALELAMVASTAEPEFLFGTRAMLGAFLRFTALQVASDFLIASALTIADNHSL
jgi:hypothetical protein